MAYTLHMMTYPSTEVCLSTHSHTRQEIIDIIEWLTDKKPGQCLSAYTAEFHLFVFGKKVQPS